MNELNAFGVLEAPVKWAVLAALIAWAVPFRASRSFKGATAALAGLTCLGIQWLWPEVAAPPIAEVTTVTPPEPSTLLNWLIGLPLSGAVALAFIPRQWLRTLRFSSYAIWGGTFVLSLQLLSAPAVDGWHFQYIADWIPAAGIRYHVAVDGISVWLIILTTLTTPIAAFAAFGSIDRRIKDLCIVFMVMQGAMLGAFVALDLFLFYIFWELMLLPMFLLIGIWGGPERRAAAMKFVLYALTGSALMLAAILYMVWTHHALRGFWSFDYLALCQIVLPGMPGTLNAQALCFAALTLAFFIKTPMFPLHTWLPTAHAQAPTGASVMLAAITLKLGAYGYLRFSMGLFPAQAATSAALLAGLAIIGGMAWAGLCAFKQSDAKRLLAYASVTQLSLVMLGLFSVTTSGIKGAVLHMVSHGLVTAALFLLVGVLQDRRKSTELGELGGIAQVMPVFASLLIVVTLAAIGAPGTGSFVGEFMIVTATFVSERLNQWGSLQATAAGFALVCGAIYMFRMVHGILFGPLKHPNNRALEDISPRETLPLLPLLIAIVVVGLFPQLLLKRIDASANGVHRRFVASYLAAKPNPKAAQALPAGTLDSQFLTGAPTNPAANANRGRSKAISAKTSRTVRASVNRAGAGR